MSKRKRPGPSARSRAGRAGRRRAGNPDPSRRPSVPPAGRVESESALEFAGALPPDGAEYPQVLRGPTFFWWRSALGAVCGLGLFLLLTAVVSQAVVALLWAITAGDQPYAEYFAASFAFERPSGMLATNLGIATLIPIAFGLMYAVHQVRPRWLISVGPGFRWRYLLGCLVIAVVALNGMVLLTTSVSEPLTFAPQPGLLGFLVVIVLTSPIQAAAEEIFFRGYLMQALGSLVAHPVFGVVVSSVVFALLHGTQNLPLFVDRLAFGLLAAVLVWKTGGLEASIAAHVVNNVFAYGIAGATSSIAALKATQELTWLDAAADVGGYALFAVLAYALFRLLKLRSRVDLSAAS